MEGFKLVSYGEVTAQNSTSVLWASFQKDPAVEAMSVSLIPRETAAGWEDYSAFLKAETVLKTSIRHKEGRENWKVKGKSKSNNVPIEKSNLSTQLLG